MLESVGPLGYVIRKLTKCARAVINLRPVLK